VAADVGAWGDWPPEEVAVRPYREPAATVMLKVTGPGGRDSGSEEVPWDAAYEMS
jgi:hypothetical protein